MKRLLRIGFDIFISSLTPILSWFFIGLLIDKDLTNVFTLTYPLQCLMGIFISIFGTGANVSGIKDNNPNSSDNGIIYGTIIGTIIFSFIALNADHYISFMNMDKSIYLVFCTYSIMQILLQLILTLILEKLYYLELNKKANKISRGFNLLNFITLVSTSLITKNQIIISITTLLPLLIFDIVLLIKNIYKIDFKLKIINCIKYDLVSFSIHIMFFIIFLFGFSNSFSFGEEYVVAITFVTIITDIQWDMAGAIKKVAKIDIVKKSFNYNYHLKNAIKYNVILIISVISMGIIIYPLYQPELSIVFVFVLLHIIDFAITPFIYIKRTYLEMEYSSIKTTINTLIAFTIRTIFSFVPTPFCTIIGQMCDSLYEFIYVGIIYKLKIIKK